MTEATLVEFPQLNITEPNWWYVKIGTGNDMLLSGTKPLYEPMLAQIYVVIQRQQWPLLLTWFNFNPSMDK